MSSTDLDTKPMDVEELKPCMLCSKGMMHTGSPVFYEVTFSSCVVDLKNVQRMHGLEQMMGGAAPLARVFSPNNTVAHRVGPPSRNLICSECVVGQITPLQLMDDE